MEAIGRFFRFVTIIACLHSGHATAVTKSSGCGKALSAGIKQGSTGSSNNITITSSGIERTFLLHVPQVYTPTNAHGLIFSFHGRSQTGAEQERLSQFSNYDFNPNMLAVYPNGVNQEWQGDPDAETDDVAFTLDMINSISAHYCIDTDKIFAAGKSNGGGFSANILACDPTASTKIAAFAGISGAYYQGTTDANCNAATVPIPCKAGREPVPIFETHGSADPVIPYDGGLRRSRCLPSIPHFMTAWSERNGLGSSNVSTKLYNDNVIEYQFGKAGGLQGINTHYWVNGLGHAWPSTNPNDDGPGTYFNATPLVMDFFNRWTLSSTPTKTLGASSASGSTQSSTSKSKSALAATTTNRAASSSSVTTPVCPAANGTEFTTDTSSYRILCGYDTTSSYFGNPISNLGSFSNCIAACNEFSECGHVVYNGVCYLKEAVKAYVHSEAYVRVAVKLS